MKKRQLWADATKIDVEPLISDAYNEGYAAGKHAADTTYTAYLVGGPRNGDIIKMTELLPHYQCALIAPATATKDCLPQYSQPYCTTGTYKRSIQIYSNAMTRSEFPKDSFIYIWQGKEW